MGDFETWVGMELPGLLRFATVLCGSPDLAQDLVQDVVLKVQQRWSKISRLESRDAYVKRMLVNEHLSFRRKVGRVVVRDHVEPSVSDRPLLADQHADRAELLGALRRLPPRQRAVLVLRYFDDADDATIALILGCRPGSVRSYATRALQALRISPLRDDHTHTASESFLPGPADGDEEGNHAYRK